MKGIPREGSKVYTFVGTGLKNPTQVLAESTGKSLRIIKIAKPGDVTPEIDEKYTVSSSCLYKPVEEGPF